jgi:hypothetical protein
MSKRRMASILMFGKKNCFKYPVKVVAVTSGTGTDTKGGVITVVASDVSTQAWLTVTTATNKATIVGTAAQTPTSP